MTCPFCEESELSTQKLFESETAYVLLSIAVSTRGRCLVVPKRHVANIKQLSEAELADFFKTVKLVSEVLEKSLKPAGFNYGLNEGKRAGQTIEHFHFHIIPRYEQDKLPEYHLFHRERKEYLTDEELREQVEEFRKIFKEKDKPGGANNGID